MMTSKAILLGALVFGAASVPAGIVVSELGTDGIPSAPAVITVAPPELAASPLRLEETLDPVVLVPPAPRAVAGVLAPDVEGTTYVEARLAEVLLLPPAPGPVPSVVEPSLRAALALDEATLARPVLVEPVVSRAPGA